MLKLIWFQLVVTLVWQHFFLFSKFLRFSSNILLKLFYLKALVLVKYNNTGAVQKKTAYCLDKNANSLFVFDTWLLQRRKDVKQYLHVFKQPLQLLCSLCCLSSYSKCMSTAIRELFSGFFLSKQTLLVGQLYSQILIQNNLNSRLCYVFALIYLYIFFLMQVGI